MTMLSVEIPNRKDKLGELAETKSHRLHAEQSDYRSTYSEV